MDEISHHYVAEHTDTLQKALDEKCAANATIENIRDNFGYGDLIAHHVSTSAWRWRMTEKPPRAYGGRGEGRDPRCNLRWRRKGQGSRQGARPHPLQLYAHYACAECIVLHGLFGEGVQIVTKTEIIVPVRPVPLDHMDVMGADVAFEIALYK